MTATDPYRTASDECSLCGASTPRDQERNLGSLLLCSRCASGEIEPAAQRWRFELADRIQSGNTIHTSVYWFELKRPTDLPVIAAFRNETINRKIEKLFGKKDVEVGQKDFDRQVIVEADDEHEEILRELLANASCRDIVVRLLHLGRGDKRGNRIELVNHLVSGLIAWSGDREELPQSVFRLHVIALGVLVERFARAAMRQS